MEEQPEREQSPERERPPTVVRVQDCAVRCWLHPDVQTADLTAAVQLLQRQLQASTASPSGVQPGAATLEPLAPTPETDAED